MKLVKSVEDEGVAVGREEDVVGCVGRKRVDRLESERVEKGCFVCAATSSWSVT